MKYDLKMMNDDMFEISEETVQKLTNAKGLVLINEINSMINMSSVVSISPKGLAISKEDKNVKKCHDGVIAVRKFGVWKDQYSGANLNLSHYPELNYPESDEDNLQITNNKLIKNYEIKKN